jgi:type III restriction enzyme
MYFGTDMRETVSVMGTPAFMEFVESIQTEGVTFEHRPMGGETAAREDSLIVEVETDNPDKNPDVLDIPLPKLTRRYSRDFKDLDVLDPAGFGNVKLGLKPFTPEQTREIVFKTMLDSAIHHTIQLDGSGPADYRSVVGFFARQLLKDLRLVGGYDILYGKVKTFMREHLFDASPVDLEDPVVLRNLSEPDAGKILYDSFKKAINALTIQQTGTTRIEDRIRLRDTRPFRTEPRGFLISKKSIFNRVVGEARAGGLELKFAAFLDQAEDVSAFAKNYLAVGFKLDYVKADGDLSTYTPDFIVRTADGTIWIVETKGREELDLPQKMARLKQWCADATAAEENGQRYDFVFVDEQGFEQHQPKTFKALVASFTEYRS